MYDVVGSPPCSFAPRELSVSLMSLPLVFREKSKPPPASQLRTRLCTKTTRVQRRLTYDTSRETLARKELLSAFTEARGTSRDGRRLLARDRLCSQVAWDLAHTYSETHGFRATRRSLAALPLKVESRYFRANVSLRVSYSVLHSLERRRLKAGPDGALVLRSSSSMNTPRGLLERARETSQPALEKWTLDHVC